MLCNAWFTLWCHEHSQANDVGAASAMNCAQESGNKWRQRSVCHELPAREREQMTSAQRLSWIARKIWRMPTFHTLPLSTMFFQTQLFLNTCFLLCFYYSSFIIVLSFMLYSISTNPSNINFKERVRSTFTIYPYLFLFSL